MNNVDENAKTGDAISIDDSVPTGNRQSLWPEFKVPTTWQHPWPPRRRQEQTQVFEENALVIGRNEPFCSHGFSNTDR